LGLHPRTLFPFREEVRGQERIELGWSGQTNQVKFYIPQRGRKCSQRDARWASLQHFPRYLSTFKPLLNILMSASADPRVPVVLSLLTRAKFSASLQGRTDSEITRARKSNSKQGVNNPFYGKGPGIKALDIAAEKAGTPPTKDRALARSQSAVPPPMAAVYMMQLILHL